MTIPRFIPIHHSFIFPPIDFVLYFARLVVSMITACVVWLAVISVSEEPVCQLFSVTFLKEVVSRASGIGKD
jgi:hypothetical protein